MGKYKGGFLNELWKKRSSQKAAEVQFKTQKVASKLVLWLVKLVLVLLLWESYFL